MSDPEEAAMRYSTKDHNSLEWISEFLEAHVDRAVTFDGYHGVILTHEPKDGSPGWELKVFGASDDDALAKLLSLLDDIGWNDR